MQHKLCTQSNEQIKTLKKIIILFHICVFINQQTIHWIRFRSSSNFGSYQRRTKNIWQKHNNNNNIKSIFIFLVSWLMSGSRCNSVYFISLKMEDKKMNIILWNNNNKIIFIKSRAKERYGETRSKCYFTAFHRHTNTHKLTLYIANAFLHLLVQPYVRNRKTCLNMKYTFV